MKMKNLTKQCIVGLSFLFIINGCDSFVEVDLPKSQLTTTAIFENYETANAALINIYAKIRDTGPLTGTNTGLTNQLGNYTDEIIAYGNPSNPGMQFYNNAVLPSSSIISGYWNTSYNQIYAANSLMEGLENSTSLSIENMNQLRGEALFIRALSHFYLTSLFGDVPYIKTTDYQKNSSVGRDQSVEVYANIVTDLENSILLLGGTYSTSDRTRPNKFVCQALLARVYLNNKSYAQAANEASAILNQTGLFSLEDPAKVFLVPSKETIWQLQSAAAGQNTKEGSLFIFQAGPPATMSLNPVLVNSFTTGDLRKTNWIKPIIKGSSTWYHVFKYKEQNNTPVSKEYSIIFRLAEQYLIRAEARIQQGDFIGAKEDLNKIRNRAGLANTVASTKEEILNAIVEERRWEFFAEHGHRFFDLKRFEQLDASLSVVKPGWNTTDNLFPIPQNELSTNQNLRPQNPGY